MGTSRAYTIFEELFSAGYRTLNYATPGFQIRNSVLLNDFYADNQQVNQKLARVNYSSIKNIFFLKTAARNFTLASGLHVIT